MVVPAVKRISGQSDTAIIVSWIANIVLFVWLAERKNRQGTKRTLTCTTVLYETSLCRNAIDEPSQIIKLPAIRGRHPRLTTQNQVFVTGKWLLVFLLPSVLAC
jgi:hypothetical protein